MRNNIIVRYIVGSWVELTKVKWPTRKEIINNTAIVIVSVGIATAITGAVDFGLSTLVQLLVNQGK